MWLLNCSWNDLSSSQKENCMAKMSYSGWKLVKSLAYSAPMKYIELLTSAGVEWDRKECGDGDGCWGQDCPGHGDGGQAGQGEGVAEDNLLPIPLSFTRRSSFITLLSHLFFSFQTREISWGSQLSRVVKTDCPGVMWSGTSCSSGCSSSQAPVRGQISCWEGWWRRRMGEKRRLGRVWGCWCVTWWIRRSLILITWSSSQYAWQKEDTSSYFSGQSLL